MHECVVSYVLFTFILLCLEYTSLLLYQCQQQLYEADAVVGLGDALPYQIAVALMVASTRDATICEHNIQCHAIEYETLCNHAQRV